MTSKRATDSDPNVPNDVRAKEQAAWEESAGNAVDTDHASVEPTEADYEKARTVGIGNEPELPPGKVAASARAQVATDAASTQAVSRARSASQRS